MNYVYLIVMIFDNHAICRGRIISNGRNVDMRASRMSLTTLTYNVFLPKNQFWNLIYIYIYIVGGGRVESHILANFL